MPGRVEWKIESMQTALQKIQSAQQVQDFARFKRVMVSDRHDWTSRSKESAIHEPEKLRCYTGARQRDGLNERTLWEKVAWAPAEVGLTHGRPPLSKVLLKGHTLVTITNAPAISFITALSLPSHLTMCKLLFSARLSVFPSHLRDNTTPQK